MEVIAGPLVSHALRTANVTRYHGNQVLRKESVDTYDDGPSHIASAGGHTDQAFNVDR